jgi:lipopolysaccharide/colanic/teichoic acid biosynthesis glycosyltransferase
MKRLKNADKLLMFLGDIIVFYGALWLALLLRNLELPNFDLYILNAVPFTWIFLVWVIVYYIASLYEPHTVVLKSRLPAMLLNVQAINSLIAAGCFYLIPAFGITPKTILFLQLIFSLIGVALWRIFGLRWLGLRRKERAVLIGSGDETRKLYRVVNESAIYPMHFITWLDLEKLDGIDFSNEILSRIYSEHVGTVVIDLKNVHAQAILPKLYNLIFSHVRFVDQYRIYEDIFDSIPLSLIGYNWFLENVSSRAHFGYDLLKRVMDVTLALVLLVPTLLLYPFVIFGTLVFQPGGNIFFTQERVGKGNHPIYVYKFRTMTSEQDVGSRRVTKFGAFMRKTRIDELPQLWNVLRGDLSMIGPRPEIPALVKHYADQIPYYNMRHLITPGLSGWAQVHHVNHPHHGADVIETKAKLSYDLYYLKNRSLALDIKIALKTIRTLLSRQGI